MAKRWTVREVALAIDEETWGTLADYLSDGITAISGKYDFLQVGPKAVESALAGFLAKCLTAQAVIDERETEERDTTVKDRLIGGRITSVEADGDCTFVYVVTVNGDIRCIRTKTRNNDDT